MITVNPLKKLVPLGCFSATGSDPYVLRACMLYAKKHNNYFMCEATVNQVNQFGGYTGMKPADYADMVLKLAEEIDFPKERIILSGDHLGPFIWQHLDSETAMKYSKELVRQYVAAGFRKIHLDPTMPLADDDLSAFGTDIIAKRAAELAAVSEKTYEATKNETIWSYRPVYVIGSEVPVPGGTQEEESVAVTTPEDLNATIECFKNAFLSVGLPQVYEDTVAVVAQIGIEFSDEAVHPYNHALAIELSNELKKHSPLRFESHSSDYQTLACLKSMIEDGVGIIKVGPEMTFALREAFFSLSKIEDELQPLYGYESSHFIDVLESVMMKSEPNYWRKYYHGTPEQQALKRKYSYSDRSRYYFTQPEVVSAQKKLLENLNKVEIPLTILSQYLPVQYMKIRNRELSCDPFAILIDKITDVVDRYCHYINKE